MIVLERSESKRIGDVKSVVSLKLEKLEGNDSPYFSATLDEYELHGTKWMDVGGGANHKRIAELFPEYEFALKWHLTFLSDGPLHYIENACYWAGLLGFVTGKSEDPPNIEYLKKTIVYGALPSDADVSLEAMTIADLTRFLHRRLPELMRAFYDDMRKLFGKKKFELSAEPWIMTEVKTTND